MDLGSHCAAPCTGIREIFAGANMASWALESEIELKGSRISLTIGIRNSSFTEKDWNPVPGIWSHGMESQNSRPSWIPLLGANCAERVRTTVV